MVAVLIEYVLDADVARDVTPRLNSYEVIAPVVVAQVSTMSSPSVGLLTSAVNVGVTGLSENKHTRHISHYHIKMLTG